MVMGLSLRAGIASDVGEYRETNQDAAFAASWGAGVADGDLPAAVGLPLDLVDALVGVRGDAAVLGHGLSFWPRRYGP